jgi:O-antigen ligase
MATLFPLAILPGIEDPFSTPKIILLAGFVVLAGIFAVAGVRPSWPPLPRGFYFALIGWFSTLIVSAAIGQYVSPESLFLSLLCIGWFIVAVALRANAVHVAVAVAASCTAVSIIAIMQYLGLDPFHLFGWASIPYGSPRMRTYSTLGNPNFVGAFLVGGTPLFLALGKLLKRKALFSFLLLLNATAVLATGSRAVSAAIMAALIWLVALRHSARWWLLALAVLMITLIFAFTPARPLKTTIEGRFYIWQVIGSHMLERPLFGFGPGGFEPKYIEWETLYWREGRGYTNQRTFAALQAHAHNDYLETIVDRGFIGLSSLVSLLGSFLYSAFRQTKTTGSELLAGASAGVVALTLVAVVDFPFQRPAELFLLWTLMAVGYLAGLPSGEVSDDA